MTALIFYEIHPVYSWSFTCGPAKCCWTQTPGLIMFPHDGFKSMDTLIKKAAPNLSHSHTHAQARTHSLLCYLCTSINAQKLIHADNTTPWLYQSSMLLMTSLHVIILITRRAMPVNRPARGKRELDRSGKEWEQKDEWQRTTGRGRGKIVWERERATETKSGEKEEGWSIVHFTKSLRRVSSVNKWINLSVGLRSMTPYRAAPPRDKRGL